MTRSFRHDQIFENLNLREKSPENEDYENCTFVNCDFSNSDLTDRNFIDCLFKDCDLSLTKLLNTSLKETRFVYCKLLGLHFDDCNRLLLSFVFDGCSVELCSFNKLRINNTVYMNSRIIESDFTGADLKNSSFINCDLDRTIFKNTDLKWVDFRSSFNYSIDPDVNQIKKARFSIDGIKGLLDKFDIGIE